MKSVLAIFLLFVSCAFTSCASDLCPVCQHVTVDVNAQKDDHSKPSKNLAVWNRSICANPFYSKGSLICTKDGYAYEAGFKTWNLRLNDRDGFGLPLTRSIYSLPLPPKAAIKSGVVYSQEFASLKSVEHSLLFWCVTDTAYFSKIGDYAKANDLTLTIEKERAKGQSVVKVSKRTEQGAAPNP